MTNDDNPVAGTESSTTPSYRVGLYSAILTVLITILTFSLAITAIPNSGAGCTENCVEYPYLNTLSEFPRDYLWMPPAMLLIVVYVTLDRKSTRLNSSHANISYAVFCLKKKKQIT